MPEAPSSAQLDALKKRVLDSTASGVLIRNPQNEIIWCNAAAEQVLGLTLEQMSGVRGLASRMKAVRPDGSPMDPEELPSELCLSTGQPVLGVIMGLHGLDGHLHWLSVDAFPLPDEGGGLLGIASTFNDITERVEVANDLVRSQEHVSDLLDCMTDAYLTIDADWKFGFVNRETEILLGRSREELVGAHVWVEFPDAVGEFQHHYQDAMGGEPVEFEAYYVGLDAWFEIRAHPVPNGIAVYFRDVTERHRAAAEREGLLASAEEAKGQLAHAAAYDPLTDLPNRTYLKAWLSEQLADGPGPNSLAVLFIDLDRFKLVNDTHGHAEGDALLVEAAHRLLALIRSGDFVARLGGDEFVVALAGSNPKIANGLAHRLLQAFRRPFDVEGRNLVVTTSIGIAFAGPEASPDNLLRDADAALYQAKDAGRNRVCLFDDRLRQAVVARLDTETDLREALDRFEMGAHYQPIFDCRTGLPMGVEVLARWHHPLRGMVQPGEFIPVAEETGLIIPLGERMLDLAGTAADDLDRALGVDDAFIWVNVSARQLDEATFADDLVARVEGSGLLGRFGVEVTESALSGDPLATEAKLRLLDSAGLRIAIDDFGTGYSSLARLLRYPVHVIKIDRSFVDGLTSDDTRPVVIAIIELARALGAKSCAEGVETDTQLQMLLDLGVDLVSGFYLCRPVPLDRLAQALADMPAIPIR